MSIQKNILCPTINPNQGESYKERILQNTRIKEDLSHNETSSKPSRCCLKHVRIVWLTDDFRHHHFRLFTTVIFLCVILLICFFLLVQRKFAFWGVPATTSSVQTKPKMSSSGLDLESQQHTVLLIPRNSPRERWRHGFSLSLQERNLIHKADDNGSLAFLRSVSVSTSTSYYSTVTSLDDDIEEAISSSSLYLLPYGSIYLLYIWVYTHE